MSDDTPHFDPRGMLIAPKYDDVYFSAADGLAETQHVFLQGNHLAERFASLPPGATFTIGETGFGTGLNFLAAWQLFEQLAPSDARLEFVSVEVFPLSLDVMHQALSPWPELATQREALLQQWGPLWPGVHRFRFDGGWVRLTLLVGEVTDVLATADARVDAWFLDGFAPARNPAMWSEKVFKQIARLSTSGTTLATYTAAGFVRRGLQAVGFDVEKTSGFGTKRDMTVGRFVDGAVDTKAEMPILSPSVMPRSVIVIGGSLAGAFAARALAERGVPVTVLDAQQRVDDQWPALSPRVAVLQPKINNQDDAAGAWLRGGYSLVERWLRSDAVLRERCGWRACGTFQAAFDGRSERRLRRFVDQFGATGLCRWVESEQTEDELGVSLSCGGVLIERAGVLWPAGLCAGLLGHPNITVRDSMPVASLHRVGDVWSVATLDGEVLAASQVVVANALGAKRFEQTQHLTLKPVRGQVTLLNVSSRPTATASETGEQDGSLAGLRRALFYGGYVLPMIAGRQTIGASFVPGDAEMAWREAEHLDVCDKLARVLPNEAEGLRAMSSPGGWVGLRVTTPTHRCYAEEIEPGLYVSLGHGSHGIASAAAAADQIACCLSARPRPGLR